MDAIAIRGEGTVIYTADRYCRGTPNLKWGKMRVSVVFAVLSLCAAPVAAEELILPPGFEMQKALTGGQQVGPDDEIIPYVVGLRFFDIEQNAPRVCAGVLVRPSVVLTAANCVVAAGGAESITAYFRAPEGEDSLQEDERSIAEAKFPPEFTDRRDQYDAALNPYDIAELKLETPAPVGSQLIMLPDLDMDISDLTTLQLSGYGGTEDDLFEDASDDFDYALSTVVDARINWKATGQAGVIVLQRKQSAAICAGDGGSPAYRVVDGQPMLLGLAIGPGALGRERDDCAATSAFVPIPQWTQWIESTAQFLENN